MQRGYALLDSASQQEIRASELEMCIYMEQELLDFQKAFGKCLCKRAPFCMKPSWNGLEGFCGAECQNMPLCANSSCATGKPSWNGVRGEHCSKECRDLCGPTCQQEKAQCKRAGCNKPTWNGLDGEYCGGDCMQRDAPKAQCRAHVVGCTKPSWNGQEGELCSQDCQYKALLGDGETPGDAKCFRDGCSKPSWNKQLNQPCSNDCRCSRQECDRPSATGAPNSMCEACGGGNPGAALGGGCVINCGRPAAAGFKTCCMKCQATNGREHGPACNTANKGPPSPGQCSINCERAASAGFETCCQTCKQSNGRQHGPVCNAKHKGGGGSGGCVLNCGRPAAVGFQTCCQTCQATDGRQHGPQCNAANVKHAVASGALCNSNCGRPAAAGYQACCQTCPASGGRHHGPACNAAKMAAGGGAAPQPGARMCVVGCGRAAADGFETCCKNCQASNGKSHGPTCEANNAGKPS